MHGSEPATYLAQRIRELVAADDDQLGIVVEVTPEHIFLRGPVDSEGRRAEVRSTAEALAAGRRVVDELDVPRDEFTPPRNPERIVP